MNPSIEIQDLSKTFSVRAPSQGRGLRKLLRGVREIKAVDRVSFQVQSGEMLGYIGPNGAGKSTTIKMLTGILVPTSGTVRVAELDPSRRRVELAGQIGVVFGQRTQLWWDLPLFESFDLLRHIYRVKKTDFKERMDRFIDVLEMQPFLQTPVRQLSLGQRMRGDLAAAMLHHPSILFLDEPTIGLDVVAKARIRDFLRKLNSEGTTILLTTHDMSDIERLCKRMLIIDHGKVIYDGDLETIRDRFGGESILVVDLDEESPPIRVPGGEVTKVEGPRQWVHFRRDQITAAELISRVAEKVKLIDLKIEEPEIEDTVRRIYTEGI